MPRGLWIVVAAMAVFAVVVLGVIAWASISGRAGSQRGLVIFNSTSDTVSVVLPDGQTGAITPDDERTFVVKRRDFPADIVVLSGGAELTRRRFEYNDFADAEFRFSVDERGFFPTETYRDTPVPSPVTGG